MADNVYGAFDLFERKMDDAIGDLGNIEEGTADVDVLLDVKSVLPRPPHFDVDDSGPFGNQTDATPPPPPFFDQRNGSPARAFGNPIDPNRIPVPPRPVRSHIGCFFHLKQAWRKYLLEKCHIDRETVKFAMQVGMLDLMCVIPAEEVLAHGIPYLRSIFGANLSKREHEKWEKFWQYFERQWMPILSSWNVAHLENDGEYYDIINRTNNGLERYNRHYNGLFPTKPDLFQFVRTLQNEPSTED